MKLTNQLTGLSSFDYKYILCLSEKYYFEFTCLILLEITEMFTSDHIR